MSIFDYFDGKNKDKSHAMEIVRERAAEAGWKIKTDNSGGIVIGFKDQLGIEDVFIKVCGKNEDGVVLEFSSHGLKLPDDMGAAALFGLQLLERNGEMLMGHWGIEDVGGEKYYTVFHTMLAEDMDVNEFKSAVRAVLNEKKRLLLEAIKSQKKKLSDEPVEDEETELELDFEFKSSDHIRYQNGNKVSELTGGKANRVIKVEPNISGQIGQTVTMFNADGNHPFWQNNVQMSPKRMKVIGTEKGKVILRGYGNDQLGASFEDYGLTIYHSDGKVEKCILHMHDRNVDIEYFE